MPFQNFIYHIKSFIMYTENTFRFLNLSLILLLCCCTTLNAYADKNLPRDAKDVIVNHKWTLVELKQVKVDSAVNMSIFLMPCEKDNFVDYHQEGIYRIHEGAKKCQISDSDIKGEGEWTYYEQDGVIMDSYSGGREVEKEVLYLDDTRMVLEFNSQGGWRSKLTYFSELGFEDEDLEETIEDNTDHTYNISSLIRNDLASAGRYVLVGRKDFEQGAELKIDDRDGVFRSVNVYPLIDLTDENTLDSETERNESLAAQGAKTGVDYVITGRIMQTEAREGSDGNYLAQVKYAIVILDTETGEPIAQQTFGVDQVKEAEKKKDQIKLFETIGTVAVLGSYARGLSYSSRYWNGYYGYYFANSSAYRTRRTMDVIFSSTIDSQEREAYYKKNEVILQALYETEEDLISFVRDNVPVLVSINDIEEHRGRAKTVFIEAGGNINLQEGEVLKVGTYDTRELSNGKVIKSVKEMGKLKVVSVDHPYLSTCSIIGVGSAKKILTAWKEQPENIKVFTTGEK